MSILGKIIDILASSGEKLERLADFTYHPYKLLYGDLKKLYKADSVNHALSRAEKRGLVKKHIINDQVYVALTKFGFEEFKRRRKNLNFLLGNRQPGVWDGKYRLVIFDIPERNRVVRDSLRNKLKEFGFVGWQQSVWITKKNVTRQLREFVSSNNLEDYILIIETRELANKKLESLLN